MTVKTQSRCTVLLAVLSVSAFGEQGAKGNETLLDRREPSMVMLAVSGSTAMSAPNLRQMYDDLASKQQRPLRFASISAFPSLSSAFFLTGKGHTETTYEDVVSEISRVKGLSAVRMMRLTAFGDNIVVQEVHGSNVSRIVLKGTDPTIFTVGSHRCELLECSFHRLPRPLRERGPNPVIFVAYLKTDSLPHESEAKEIVLRIRDLSGQNHLWVEIRTDTWFIDSAGFPLWYPFNADINPPNYSEYVSRGQVSCSSDEKGISCSPAQFPVLPGRGKLPKR